MANSDIVKKKPVALDLSTYERLSRLAAQLRIDNPGGGFVSMSVAVGRLLDTYESNLRPVVIKDGANRYVNNATVATANLFLTNNRTEAMVFDSSDQAKEFLRNCGREIGDWIIEPA